MNTKRKRKKNRFMPMAFALGIFIGSICNSYMKVYAEALPGLPPGVDLVSVADCMMAYFTSAGVYISNQDWLNELYTSFGGGAGFYIGDLYQNGLLTLDEAGHFVSSGLDAALENQSAWTSLHLDELFNVSAQEAAVGGGVAATGAGTVAGAVGGVASTGLLPLAFGVTGAYWGGIGLGTLAAHLLGLYDTNIYNGLPVTLNTDQIGQIIGNANSYARAYYANNNNIANYYTNDDVRLLWMGYRSGSTKNLSIFAYNSLLPNQSFNYFSYFEYPDGTNSVPSRSSSSFNQYGFKRLLGGNYWKDAEPIILFNSEGEYNSFVNGLNSGQNEFPEIMSPDLIGKDGNLVGDRANGNIVVPSLVPQIDPNNESVKPGNLTETDYSRWARQANQNTTDDDPDANADIFEQILEALKNLAPSPGVNPNPDPSTTPVPKPDYDPSQPDQPEYDPKETEGPQDVTNGSPWTTPDILDKFPFCIPRDILRCFEALDPGARQAPEISWHFTTPMGIHFDFDLDLSDYESVAAILRLLELIGFVVGLAVATRNLIGR